MKVNESSIARLGVEENAGVEKAKRCMTTRTFYRTVIEVEVLSEEPVYFDDLAHVHEAIMDDCSGSWNVVSSVEVDGATMAKLLIEQASDPEFFCLTDDGEDWDGDEQKDDNESKDAEEKAEQVS